MSWQPPNQPNPAGNFHNYPGRPNGAPPAQQGEQNPPNNNYDESQHRYQFQQPTWQRVPWPANNSNIIPHHAPPAMFPPGFGMPHGAQFGLPHHMMGYGTPQVMQQQWSSAFGGQVRPGMAPFLQAQSGGPVMPQPSHPQASQPQHQQLSSNASQSTEKKNPSESHKSEDKVRQKPAFGTITSSEDSSSLAKTERVKESQASTTLEEKKPAKPLNMESLQRIKEWASSLVGRDWEIFWNDTEDSQTARVESEGNTAAEGDDGADEAKSEEGDIIDDWYDGRILSADVKTDGTVQGRAIFVGDDTVYEMELTQSKVRPSARAWIKRTTALLLRKDGLPSDTATSDDHHHLKNIQEVSRHYEPLSLQPNPSIRLPELHDLNDILLLRKDLKAQIYLRSKLSKIVNLHGSVKYIAGELNPTEPLVNHLVECCVDLDQACDWYLRSWELLTTCFGQKSGQSSNETDSYQRRSLKYEQLLDDYMEFGKNAILNCVSMDTESSTNAKRRQLVAPPGQRRTKRRRKKYNMHEDQDVDAFGEEDFRSMVAVDQFAQRLILQTRWYLPIFATMIQTVAHLVIHPLVQWTCRADQLLGLGNDLSELLDEEGEDISESRSDANCEAESIVSSATDDEQRLFPFDAITDCLKTLKSDPVLILADLSEQEQALHAKVEAATALAKRANSLLVRVGEYCTGTSEDSSQCSDDEILCGLREVAKYLETPGHGAHNIDPLATDQVEVSRITIDNAILWRAFALDVWHVFRVRERKSFIEDLVTRLEELPDPTGLAIEGLRLTLEQKVRQKAEILESLIGVETRYTGLIQNGVVGQGIMSKEGLEIALEGLCQLPVLLIVEEKMLLRLNYIHWRERTIEQLPNDNSPVPFHLLENIHTSLNSLLQGKTEARKEATTNLIANEKVEAIIRAFTDKDTDAIDPILKERVMALYNASSDWKDRAETIISTLRVHGNPVAGSVILGTKSPTFVDIKRISDMIKEYQSLDVVIPEYVSILQAVMDDAKSWASSFEENLVKSLSIAEAGSVLSNAKSLRPNGLIMDPTRQVLDTMGDLLDWHQRSRDVWGRLDVMLHDNSAAMSFDDLSQAIRTDVYPIFAEGLDVVEYFSHKNQKKHKVSAAVSLSSLEVKFNVRRSAKAPTIEKITIHPLGRLLLERIASEEFDTHEGSPMSLFVWADWHLSVAVFVKSINAHDGTPNKLSQALIHRSSEPGINTCNDFRVQKALRDFKTREKARLEELIYEAEDVERNARALLSESRELRRGCVNKMDAIKVHLASLKTMLAAVKDRASGNHGLELDSGHEVNLENDVRIFTWLAKTLSYPFLYLDETSYAIFAKRNERIPWDVLVPLAERLPQSDNSTIDDFALVSMRISELYSVAKRWQDEITRLTLLSNRGGKRRNQLQLPTKEEDQETSKLQIEKMQQLADDQILSKVEMPRESAVRTILEKSKEFDIKLHAFLRQDFDGKNADRAAYPGSRSLVGRRGEFVLFRLTGSELFESVRRAMEELAAISENVFAETPEKITFEWIQRAVTWIDELNEAATDESPFGNDANGIFTIPEEKARIFLKRGKIIFPDIPKELKSTLSQHGIFVSANKVGETLKVSLKKDGAHHSVGGTVIRWCPILLKCLSNDMLRMEEWQKELRVLIEDFSVFQKHKNSNQSAEEHNMYSWYRHRERAAYLWKHGSQSLVVSPRSGLISTFNQLFVQLKNHFTNDSSRTEFDRKFSRMWFLEGRPVIEQRCILLESLLYRNSLDVPPDRIALPDDGQKSFRDTCRAILMTCFTNATKSAGFDRLLDSRVISSDVLQSFCALRSWEIENAMFDHFQEDLGTTKASPEYFAKVRNLKASLNEKNVSLCLEILIGNITAEKLVDMSSEELASQSVKNARARSEEEARKSALLVAVSKANDTKQNQNDAFGSLSKTASSPKPRSILRKSLSPILPAVTEGTGPTLDSSDDEASTGSPPMGEAEDADENVDLKPSAFRSDSPPPPPPSLLNAFQPSDSTEDEGEYGEQIFCTSGESEFQFEINQLRLTFHTSLYLEDSKQSKVDRFLPDTLTAIGRLAGDEFASWVSDKAARGRWVVVPLRVVPNSDRDERDLSKLTESFERQNRLAMFAPSPETKVFVVTPGFQSVAEKTGAMQFGNRSSSYAVVVTRDSRLG